VALWAVKVAKERGVDSKYTYGWQRAEILGALVNGVFLVALCLSIFLEAIQRFVEPQIITNPVLILGVGFAGFCSNLIGLVLFHEHGHGHGHSHGHSHSHGHEDEEDTEYHDDPTVESVLPQQAINDIANENTTLLDSSSPSGYSSTTVRDRRFSETHVNHYHAQPKKGDPGSSKSLNMQGVFLHVMGDALGNIGVMATAIFIWKTDYSWKYYMDPVISLVITGIIFSSALPLCRSASSILLQAVPQSVNADEVRQDIESLRGVEAIHDLHIWILKEDLFIATLHVSVSVDEEEFMHLAEKINACLQGHGIHSSTIQPEFCYCIQNAQPSPDGVSLHSHNSNSSNHLHCVVRGSKSTGGLRSCRSCTNLPDA
jgi:zinc transporter 1